MTREEWEACSDPTQLLLKVLDVCSPRQRRLFAVACCRRIWADLTDGRSQASVLTAEQFVEGRATPAQLQQAHEESHLLFKPRTAGQSLDASTAANLASESDEQRGYHIAVQQRAALATADVVAEWGCQLELARCLFFRCVSPGIFPAAWLSPTVLALATGIYQERAFDRQPILADALEESGCDDADVLAHCRTARLHARGCWVIEGILGQGRGG